MKPSNAALLLTAVVAQVVADRLPASVFATGLRYAGLGCVGLHIALTARAGYRRRLPYWTRDSWRRYFRACAIPLGALAMFFGLVVAQDYRLLDARPSGAILRAAWIVVMLVFFLAGVWGLSKPIAWLNDGDPSRQFTRFPKRQ